MSMLDKALAAFGLQRTETTAERKELDRLRFCTDTDEQYLAALHQAVLIAQMGGTTDEKLEALMHLGTVGMMLPMTEQALHRVGIDTRPWGEVEAEWRTRQPQSGEGDGIPNLLG